MTYLLMSIPFLVAAAVAAWAWRPSEAVLARRRVIASLVAFAVLFVLTAVFDSLIIGTGIVAYGEGRNLGWTIGLAPIEDFLYPLAGVLLLPAVWHLASRRWPGRRAERAAAVPGEGRGSAEGPEVAA